ncbi:MAG: response regulator transcription factor [Candidatus Didemnitutus sp.]|nr:response regulator transcription factor [Candidatus Didemnitutus sp.]
MAKILLIDDDDLFRDMLASALEREGHVVNQATNGVQGLKMFRAEQADLVITDIVMPEKEGLDTIRDLRRDFPAARIIAMSGGLANDSRLYLLMAEKFGARAVLAKPFPIEELYLAVNSALADPTP